MSRSPAAGDTGSGGGVSWLSGWRAVVAVAATYVFFLLWDQYGFLELLQERLDGTAAVQGAMAAMGLAGLAASLAVGWVLGRRREEAGRRAGGLLTVGFLACAGVAPAALLAHGRWSLTAVSAAIGVATALVTVPLAAGLRHLTAGTTVRSRESAPAPQSEPSPRFGLAVGTGTGLAYLVCNLPPLFEGSPRTLAFFVAAVALLGAAVVGTGRRRAGEARTQADEALVPTGALPLLPRRAFRGAGFVAVVVAFLALVWFDSAAFAVIQQSAALKAATWGGSAHSLGQGVVHLLAALAAGWVVDRRRLTLLPPAAFLLFLVAFPLLASGGPAVVLAGPLYAVGISLYSVGLVAYPAARGDEAGLVPRRWRAAVLFGVAGWIGSALGVGMAQDLHRVPGAFLVAAGVALAVATWLARPGRSGSGVDGAAGPDDPAHGVVSREPGSGSVIGLAETGVQRRTSGPDDTGDRTGDGARGGAPPGRGGELPHRVSGRTRSVLRLLAAPLLFALAAVVLSLAPLGSRGEAATGFESGTGLRTDIRTDLQSSPLPAAAALPPATPEAVARGRRVYVAEGCIHCHSQYVRPLPRDVEMWGPHRPLDRDESPPLVGNRRQGPDLRNVGNRRSPEWHRLHLLDPRSLVPESRMPSYAHLFAQGDRRGDDLVAYLSSLGQDTALDRWEIRQGWPAGALPAGVPRRGRELFATWCAACHGDRGRGDGPLAAALARPGLDLASGGLGGGSFRLLTVGGGEGGRSLDGGSDPTLDRELARLVKFGAPGSPMPGHEWLTEQEVSDLVSYLHTMFPANATDGRSAAVPEVAVPEATAPRTGRRRLPRRVALAGAATLPLLALAALALTGWTTPPRSWRQATGWDRIPPEQRAPLAATPWETEEPWLCDRPAPPRLTWLGHSGFLLEWHGVRLLLDPNSNPRCTVARRVMAERVDPASLGHVDAALVSHAHYDHLDLETLAGVPDLGAVVVPRGSEGYLRSLPPGVERVGLAEGESRRFGDLEVVAVEARHNGDRFHPLASEQEAVGYVVRSADASLFFAGDTAWGPHLAEIGRRWQPRAAILPIGAFAPRIPLRWYHLSPEEAVRAAEDLGVEVVVPAHFGTYPLSLDSPDAALPRFAAAAARADLRWVMPVLPGEGAASREDGSP